MKNNKEKNNFDAVKLMREIRDKLSSEYIRHPDKEEKDLSKIRKKYNIKNKSKIAS